jgi:hypothetical protein
MAQVRRRGRSITPARYAKCLKTYRDAIKSGGHEDRQVIMGAVNPIPPDDKENPTVFVRYYQETLRQNRKGNVDGIAIHTYAHGQDITQITSDSEFRRYMRLLSSHTGDLAWRRRSPCTSRRRISWIAGRTHRAKRIRCGNPKDLRGNQTLEQRHPVRRRYVPSCLYRWYPDDNYHVGKQDWIKTDFIEAQKKAYRWDTPAPEFAHYEFERRWMLTDLDVKNGAQNRLAPSWIWGNIQAQTMEDYDGTKRQVQYFDKARWNLITPRASEKMD